MQETKQTSVVPSVSTSAPPRNPVPRVGYAVAIGVAVVFLAGGLVWGIGSLVEMRHEIDAFARVDVPGHLVVRVPDATGRVLYYEGPGAPTLAMLDVSVSGPGGVNVPVHAYDGNVEYDAAGGLAGRTVGTFDAPRGGSYTVTAGRALGARAVLAVGPSIVRTSGWKVAGGVVIALVGLAFAAVIAIVTAVRRSA
jgi:hypothetical protein